MKVHKGTDSFNKIPGAVVTSGTFDGVHLGHQVILKRLKQIAEESRGASVVITFWPHPRTVLNPDQKTKLLSTLEEKIQLMQEQGPDHLVIIPFTKEFAAQTSDEFIKKVLVEKIGTKTLVIGYDHRFGKNREGSFEYLKENSHNYGFNVEEIPREDIESVTVSSTNIRKSLEEGKPEEAKVLLGRPYFLTGKVVQGEKLGRTIGYPTANIEVQEGLKLIPADGVYAVTVDHEGTNYKGMMNIGFRPTVDGRKRVLEVNLFNFNKEIYENILKINFIKYIRPEKKFSSLEDLKDQLYQDKLKSQRILN